jgi:hypothetical protein
VKDWLNGVSKEIIPHDFLVVWNSVSDIAKTLNMQFKGNQRDSTVAEIYHKLFASNNLPSMNGEH